ncbi:unnamed protein product, partial [Symbiodinium microadriaticum]
MPALSSIRETDGLTLELSEPVNEQISAGSVAAKEQPSEAAGPVEAPPSGVAAKKEDEGPATRKPLLSDDCCTCYACNISVPYKEMMGQHMMSEGSPPQRLTGLWRTTPSRDLVT